MNTLADRLTAIRQFIAEAERRHGRPPGSVKLLAVSKTHPWQDLAQAYACGQRRFGESYVQEAIEKIEQLPYDDIEWHFIGPVQSNKTRLIARYFDWVHSVDRLKIAQRLSEQRPPEKGPLQVCIQVNISGEATKSGVPPAQVNELARAIAGLPRLQLRGLMAIPAATQNEKEQLLVFRQLATILAELVKGNPAMSLDTLSMGMTHDLEAAIAEGATIVRVGTGIFGERP